MHQELASYWEEVLDIWERRLKDDPDAVAAIRDLRHGESHIQQPQTFGGDSVLSAEGVAEVVRGEARPDAVDVLLADIPGLRGRVPWAEKRQMSDKQRFEKDVMADIVDDTLSKMKPERAELLRRRYGDGMSLEAATEATGGAWAGRKMRTAQKEFARKLAETVREYGRWAPEFLRAWAEEGE